MNGATGTISGTPSVTATTQTYTVTASSASSNAVGALSITVNAAATSSQSLPNMDQTITPLAPPGATFQQLNPDLADDPAWLAQHAATSVVSPDGKTLLVMTSGYNRFYNTSSDSLTTYYPPDSNEYVFIYDISKDVPMKQQVLQIPTTYHGIVFDPNSNSTNAHFYVAGCANDNVHIISYNSDTKLWAEDTRNGASAAPLGLDHVNADGIPMGVGLPVVPSIGSVPVNAQVFVYPCAAGVAISKTGQTMVVANYFNDSISVFTGGYGSWQPVIIQASAKQPTNLDLRPGKSLNTAATGTPGGEYPFWVVVAGTEPYAVAYVSSIRDREIDVVPLSAQPVSPPTSPDEFQVTFRIPVKGQPNKMTINAAQTLLYVSEDLSDTVDVIDINPAHASTVNTVIETIPVIAPVSLLPPAVAQYTGANTNSVALSPDGTHLYVTNGNLNDVAVVQLTGTNSGDHVIGLLPTGWYPNSVSVSNDGTTLYVANAKSPTGANPDWCYGYGPPTFLPDCFAQNQYNPQLTKAGLQSIPVPTTSQLATLTAQVATNDRFSSTESPTDAAVMAAVSRGVQHVIFIIKENRTYDQVLGDLVDAKGNPIGAGEPSLVQWGQSITPNLHNLARTFVTLDHFFATSEVSYDGWLWTTAARSPDIIEHQFPVSYAFRALSLDSEGLNRSVNVGMPTVAERQIGDPLTPNDPDLLPGEADAGAPDGPNDEINTGYLWNAAMRAGLSVRNYGFFVDATCYNEPACQVPLAHDPAATNTIVGYPTNTALAPYTDLYFRGFDNAFPDYYRYTEWERDFDANYAKSGLPSLSLVRLMHDHTGSFSTAIDLVNTPELMQADNDYAVALLVQKIANSVYAQNTLIFVVEDDAQDGADHIDSHRTVAFVAGAYVKQGAVVSTPYTTLDFVRTIEEVLGLKQWLNLNDALAHPMADIFNTAPSRWSFTAVPSNYLYATQLPLPPLAAGTIVPKSTHTARYWARVTKGLDFSDADRVDPVVYNRILWKGMMGGKPYPPSLAPASSDEYSEQTAAHHRRSPR